MATQNSINNTLPSGVTVSGGAVSINSGTASFDLSNDASATTVNIATGAASKVVTVGSTNTTSSLALKYGTADFTLASATGTVMSALDTGEITFPLQSAFLAVSTSTQTDVTGDGTVVTVAYGAETYDQNSDYNTGTYTFTAPVTGKYSFVAWVHLFGLSALHTGGDLGFITSNGTKYVYVAAPGLERTPANSLTIGGAVQVDMDAADTCYVNVGVYNSTKVVDFYGDTQYTYFAGHLFA